MQGDLAPCTGRIQRHSHLKMGRYHQHSIDQLNLEQSPVEFMRDKFSSLDHEVDVRPVISAILNSFTIYSDF